MRRNLSESIKEAFELTKFISRYSGGEVTKKIKTDSPEIVKLSESVTFFSKQIDENGQQYKFSTKGGIDKRFFKDNLLKHFEEEKAKHEDLEKIDFIEAQIKFLDRINEKANKDYTYILSSLRRSVEEAVKEVGDSLDYSHRERALAQLLKVEFDKAKSIPRKDQKPKKFEQAFDSLNEKTKSKTNPYREPTKKELENIIPLLENFPIALNEVKGRLQKISIDKE